jgi:hypothetical protein
VFNANFWFWLFVSLCLLIPLGVAVYRSSFFENRRWNRQKARENFRKKDLSDPKPYQSHGRIIHENGNNHI